jgi:hypothetical protein
VSPAVIAAAAELLEMAAQLLRDHGDGKITEAEILAKVAAAKAVWATTNAAAHAAAEAVLDAKFPTETSNG